MRRWSAVLAVGLLGLASHPDAALVAATFSGCAYGTCTSVPGSVVDAVNGISSMVTLTAGTAPTIDVAVSTVQTTPHDVEGGSGEILYRFRISGSAASAHVVISAEATAGGTGQYYTSNARVDFGYYDADGLARYGSNATFVNAYDCGVNTAGCGIFAHNPSSTNVVSLELPTNLDFFFHMAANASVDNSGPGTATAFVDPTVTFDPNYAVPDGTVILFSDNLADTAVPEPSSLPLLGVGVFALIQLRRRGPPQGSSTDGL